MNTSSQGIGDVGSSSLRSDPPKRPTRFDESVRRTAAEGLAKAVAEWAGDDGADIWVKPLVRALRYEDDGYRIARQLENDSGVDADADLVNILDGHGLWGAERNAVAEWVKQHGPQLTLPDGATVRWARGVGEITGRDEAQATYTIWNASCLREKAPRCGFVVPAEQVVLADGSEATKTGADGGPGMNPK